MVQDTGGWIIYPLFLYPAAALLISAITLIVLQRYSSGRLTPQQSVLIPVVTGAIEAVLLTGAHDEPWYWLFIGTAVTIGASVVLGTAVRNRAGIAGSIAFAIMIGGILLARLFSLTPLRGMLILAVSGSATGFAVGYVAPSIRRMALPRFYTDT